IGNRPPDPLSRRVQDNLLLDSIGAHMQPPGCIIIELARYATVWLLYWSWSDELGLNELAYSFVRGPLAHAKALSATPRRRPIRTSAWYPSPRLRAPPGHGWRSNTAETTGPS